ncbi:hypothetical protein [Sulfobacillus harzensis]|uniref:Uncharacterized protein n=1 Tax=Sulfobacillus harzensis TaxID=2729629 RepID=A0A7Y0Q2V1_9FIRM|nr:hypothetical protein [Sulfobacillus harzensis]NMP23553.1 hypothetical protein [Sulfobacillus harzensis]
MMNVMMPVETPKMESGRPTPKTASDSGFAELVKGRSGKVKSKSGRRDVRTEGKTHRAAKAHKKAVKVASIGNPTPSQAVPLQRVSNSKAKPAAHGAESRIVKATSDPKAKARRSVVPLAVKTAVTKATTRRLSIQRISGKAKSPSEPNQAQMKAKVTPAPSADHHAATAKAKPEARLEPTVSARIQDKLPKATAKDASKTAPKAPAISASRGRSLKVKVHRMPSGGSDSTGIKPLATSASPSFAEASKAHHAAATKVHSVASPVTAQHKATATPPGWKIQATRVVQQDGVKRSSWLIRPPFDGGQPLKMELTQQGSKLKADLTVSASQLALGVINTSPTALPHQAVHLPDGVSTLEFSLLLQGGGQQGTMGNPGQSGHGQSGHEMMLPWQFQTERASTMPSMITGLQTDGVDYRA